MKLITAIINRKDINSVCNALTKAGFTFTKMNTSGGFLKMGNFELLIVTDDNKVKKAIETIRNNCSKRIEIVPKSVITQDTIETYQTAEVLVAGAMVIVTNVEYFEKM
ncbi:MAG: cyclic-di-AMP receptor [Bacilli bacterium]|nr:cyclic-di-AMP receptor [Acholeplasmataceae bacterium]MDY2902843.1 cyclic-di-AMP receptor [Bacilli bacterium]